MRNIVLLLLVVSVSLYGYKQYQLRTSTPIEAADESAAPASAGLVIEPQFKCDGRTYCSQMTSCAEATFFLRNCPGTKMDGNHDGTPCEAQWCRQ
jgi:hypothetical protein